MDMPPSEYNMADHNSEEEEDNLAVNPAPPLGATATDLGTVLHSDAIGDTLFSERGVLRTLMALNAAVPRYLGLEPADADGAQEGPGDADGAAGDSTGGTVEKGSDGRMGASADTQGTGGETDSVCRLVGDDTEVKQPGSEEPEPALMELDSELEEQLCQLWDMCAERAVAEFAVRSGLLEVTWPLLGRSPCPRLLEIVAGTLANCAGHGAAALPGGADTAASAAALLIANSRGDAPVLRETLRLVQAAACAQPEPEPLLRALSGWLPLLAEVLRGALSAPLLRQALSLLAAVAELPGRHDWWLAELATVSTLPEAVLEGLAQLVSVGGGGVTAEEALGCCRDALVLLAEVETVDGAAKPESDSWLAPVPRLVRGVGEARRAAAAAADPRLACCLLWLAAPALRRYWSDDTLAALLRFCDAALCTSEEQEEDVTGARPTDPAGDEVTAEDSLTAAMEDELSEARAELAARLDATAAFVARHCGPDASRFVLVTGRRREVSLLLTALERTEPELARRLRSTEEAGTHRL